MGPSTLSFTPNPTFHGFTPECVFIESEVKFKFRLINEEFGGNWGEMSMKILLFRYHQEIFIVTWPLDVRLKKLVTVLEIQYNRNTRFCEADIPEDRQAFAEDMYDEFYLNKINDSILKGTNSHLKLQQMTNTMTTMTRSPPTAPTTDQMMTDALLTGARVGRGGGGNIGRLVVVGGGGGRRVVVVVDVVVVGVVVSRGGRGDAPTEVTMVLQHV